jgi:hypothetical protein
VELTAQIVIVGLGYKVTVTVPVPIIAQHQKLLATVTVIAPVLVSFVPVLAGNNYFITLGLI